MSSFRIFFIIAVLLISALPAEGQQNPASSSNAVIALRLDHRFSPKQGATIRSLSALPDTVRVLALMVDFQEDDDSRTSGTGKFGSIYEYDYGTEILDPLPHDRTYFQQHLQFLENYVRKASGWKTILKAEVLDGVVTMPKKLGDYSFRKGESESPVAQFTIDAWTLAGTQFPSARFGEYDMFVIFHAGRGRDIDLTSSYGYDPTPLDIPSLSFTIDGYQRLIGASFDGIDMPDGSRIRNCSVVPTTNIREIPYIDGSRGLLEITINGLLAASFGTYAGLPDLFDTETGKTGIGRFGLMDGEGIFAYGGICPPEPSAWEKQQLGWTFAREAAAGKQNYLLTASDTLSTPDVLRVPITNREYWLLENRQRDLGGNGQLVTFVSGGQVQQVRFPKDTLGFENSNVQQLKGVIIDVEDFDWALPGGRVIVDDNEIRVNGGILVWHIDENIIEEYLSSNTVNTGRQIKGVDLEQAGGPQDIGLDIETVFGTETGTGSPLDYWSRDNISPVYKNRFDLYSFPNTRANSGAFTHVKMDNFSSSGPIMTLDIAVGDNSVAPVAGWPVDVAQSPGSVARKPAVQTADLDGDGEQEILVTYSSPGTAYNLGYSIGEVAIVDTVSLYIFHQDGTPFLSSGPLVFRDPAARFASPIVVGDWNQDGVSDIALVTRDSMVSSPTRLWVFSPKDNNADGNIDIQQRLDYDAIHAMPALVGGKLVFRIPAGSFDRLVVMSATTEEFQIRQTDGVAELDKTEFSRRIIALNDHQVLLSDFSVITEQLIVDLMDGQSTAAHIAGRSLSATRLTTNAIAAAAGDMDGDGVIEAVLSGAHLLVASSPDDANTVNLWFRDRDIADGNWEKMHAAMADVDGDGRLDAVLSNENAMRVVNYSLSSIDEYPVPYPVHYALSADLGSGHGHAVFGVGEDQIWQFTTGARQADGFPIPLPTDADVVLLPSRGNRLSIAAASPEGAIFLYETDNAITPEQLIWRSRNGDERNAFSVTRPFVASAPIKDFFPLERCYNWPNPVYDNTTYIRLYAAEAASVTIKIYDLAGDKVDEISADVAGGTDTDIPWNVADIQSDTYLAHVKVTSGANTGEKIIKIAVVK